MRHLKAGRALGVKPAHRRSMMRNLVTSLLEHEQITTTVARAKEMRIPLEKMVTLGKKGDLSARRRALAFIKSKKAMSTLFDELPERYAERAGGYCRIVRVGRRHGDGAEMALIQMVDGPNDVLAHAEKPATRRRGGGGGKVQAEVAEQVKGTGKAEKVEAEAPEIQEEADKQEKGKSKAAKAEAPEIQEEAAASKEIAADEAEKEQAAAPEEESKAKPKTEDKAPKAEAAPEAGTKEKETTPKNSRKGPAKKAEASVADKEKAPKPKKAPAKSDEEKPEK